MDRVDVLDERGNPTGVVKTIAEAHRDGDWHRSVHVWILNSRGELLLQLRSGDSHLAPNSWDISVAGHVAAGHGSVYSAMKEAREELGLTLASGELEHLATLAERDVFRNERYNETITHNELSDIYLVRKDVRPEDIRFADGEVEDIQWIHWRELERWVEEKKPGLVSHPQEYKLLFEKLKQDE